MLMGSIISVCLKLQLRRCCRSYKTTNKCTFGVLNIRRYNKLRCERGSRNTTFVIKAPCVNMYCVIHVLVCILVSVELRLFTSFSTAPLLGHQGLLCKYVFVKGLIRTGCELVTSKF